MVFIQIGAKDGNDEFNLMVRKERPLIVILVEPNKQHNADILRNYEDVSSHIYLENVAIVAEPAEEVTLVHPDHIINGVEYDSGKFSLLPMDDWGETFVEIKAPGMTFDSLCSKYGVKEIDFLQIDTEGYDSEIIKSIDFNKYKIRRIKYETWHFSPDCFKRHGEKGKTYGAQGIKDVNELLTELGYKLEKLPNDIIATHG